MDWNKDSWFFPQWTGNSVISEVNSKFTIGSWYQDPLVSWESENSGQMTNQILEKKSRYRDYLTDWKQLLNNSVIAVSESKVTEDGIMNGGCKAIFEHI